MSKIIKLIFLLGVGISGCSGYKILVPSSLPASVEGEIRPNTQASIHTVILTSFPNGTVPIYRKDFSSVDKAAIRLDIPASTATQTTIQRYLDQKFPQRQENAELRLEVLLKEFKVASYAIDKNLVNIVLTGYTRSAGEVKTESEVKLIRNGTLIASQPIAIRMMEELPRRQEGKGFGQLIEKANHSLVAQINQFLVRQGL